MSNKTLERISLKYQDEVNDWQKDIIELHKKRYIFASKFVSNAMVLDIACGTGYGSAILADAGAKHCIGIDLSNQAILEAKELYQLRNLDFYCLDYKKLTKPDEIDQKLHHIFSEKFDVIVSIETIEHIADPDHFLKTILKGLHINGIFIASVPVTPSTDANPYHLHDFTSKKLKNFLKNHDLTIIEKIQQCQVFNPHKIKKNMQSSGRELRKNLSFYYMKNPKKFVQRILSTLRFGFVNLYDVVAAKKIK